MNDYECAKLDMFDVLQKICRINYATFGMYAPFVSVFADFESKLTELKVQLGKQMLNSTGITLDKRKARKLLETDSELLNSVLVTFARLSGLNGLATGAKYSHSAIVAAADRELVGISHLLLMEANANLAGLAPYMITEGWIEAFEEKINRFLSYIDAPANARAETVKAGQQIKLLMPEIMDLLRNYLDPIMYHFKATNSTLFANYKSSRKIIAVSSQTPALKGTVSDSNGNPQKGMIVRLQGSTRKSITTAKGNFKFMRLKAGKYSLIIYDQKTELAKLVVSSPSKEMVEVVVGELESTPLD